MVRHVRGGPVLTVKAAVGHLLLCEWVDEQGRERRQTFSPNELAVVDAAHLLWLRVFARLAARWPVAATC